MADGWGETSDEMKLEIPGHLGANSQDVCLIKFLTGAIRGHSHSLLGLFWK